MKERIFENLKAYSSFHLMEIWRCYKSATDKVTVGKETSWRRFSSRTFTSSFFHNLLSLSFFNLLDTCSFFYIMTLSAPLWICDSSTSSSLSLSLSLSLIGFSLVDIIVISFFFLIQLAPNIGTTLD